MPISVAASTTLVTDSDKTCTSCCAVCDDAKPLGSCNDHDRRFVHFSNHHHPTRPPGPRPKKKRMSRDVSRRTGRFGMSYHQTDYDRFEKAEHDRKRKAIVHEQLHPDSPPLPTDEFYTKGEIPEVDPTPTLQWWRLCGSGKGIEGHTFGEPSRSLTFTQKA